MIIAPQKQFLVDYKINNPSDTATHYVRSVIKNAISGLILATLSLTDNGSGYFSYLWNTPADPSGTGLQITATTTVYDDAAYTSESVVYGTTVDTHIIRDLAGVRTLFGGTGSTKEIDYSQIEKIIRKVVAELPEPEKPEKYNDESVLESLDELKEHILDVKDEVVLAVSQNIDAIQSSERVLKQHITDTEQSETVKEHAAALAQDKLTSEEFTEVMDQLRGLIERISQEATLEREEVKGFFEEFVEKVENILSQPARLELPEIQLARGGKENLRSAMIHKLLSS